MYLPVLNSVYTLLNDRSVWRCSSTRSSTRLQKGVYNWVCDHNQKFSEEFFQDLSLINFEELRWSGLTGSKIVFVFPWAILSLSAVLGRISESFVCASLKFSSEFSAETFLDSREIVRRLCKLDFFAFIWIALYWKSILSAFFYIKDVAFSEPLLCGGKRTYVWNIMEFSTFLHFRLFPWRDRSLCSLLLTTDIMK